MNEAESRTVVISPANALSRLPGPGGVAYAKLFAHGSLSIEVYAPRGVDKQQPHTRDELYIVIAGHGEFAYGTERQPFATGDLIFVPAHLPHRFDNFSDDFAAWVAFYGPEGGEHASA
jgi:mannose-6-phosphate isomerase-like protein (cupin superfamily)